MKQDQQLRRIMDEAPIADLVPDFDPDAGWQEVNSRLEPQRRRVGLKGYMPYAAAIVAVLLLLLRQKEDTSLLLVALRDTAPRVQQPQIRKERENSLPAPDRCALATEQAVPPAAQHDAPALIQPPAPADTIATTVVPESAVPLKAPLAVKHYADIAPVLPAAEEYPTADAQKKGFLRSRIARRRIASQAGMKEEAPIRGLMYAFSNKE